MHMGTDNIESSAMSAIKRIRKDKGITQAEIAAGLEMDRTNYVRKEQGKVPTSIEEFKKICAIMEIDPTDVLRTSEEAGIPVIAYISAGEGIAAASPDQYAVGHGLEYLSVPPGYTAERARMEGIYGLIVRGDSMKPKLKDGWRLYVRPAEQKILNNGDLVIFRDAEGLGWVKEIEVVNTDTIIFRSVGTGQTIVKRKEEIERIERVYLIMP
jgi:transcriptional regulator with XRE-family HTH domain